MSANNIDLKEPFKQCACRECDNAGDTYLEIELIKRRGWFCNSCATDLKRHGIAGEV